VRGRQFAAQRHQHIHVKRAIERLCPEDARRRPSRKQGSQRGQRHQRELRVEVPRPQPGGRGRGERGAGQARASLGGRRPLAAVFERSAQHLLCAYVLKSGQRTLARTDTEYRDGVSIWRRIPKEYVLRTIFLDHDMVISKLDLGMDVFKVTEEKEERIDFRRIMNIPVTMKPGHHHPVLNESVLKGAEYQLQRTLFYQLQETVKNPDFHLMERINKSKEISRYLKIKLLLELNSRLTQKNKTKEN